MAESESLAVGIVVERRDVDNPWIDHSWQAVAVIPGAPEIDEWRELAHGEGWVRYHAGTLAVELFRRETEGYKHNLSLDQPAVYVVLREGEELEDHDVEPVLATVCPYEAQDYQDSGEEIVDKVAMPDVIAAWVADFVERHHVEEPFVKRKRQPHRGAERGRPGANGRGHG